MSDSEDSGSDDDGFDEEAERERLREKYERDKQRREATQKMSELLLQGATMTNHHCDECGSPIFRYDGEEFCPSCGGTTDAEVAADQADADQQAPADASQDATPAGQEPARDRSPRRTGSEATSAGQDLGPGSDGTEADPRSGAARAPSDRSEADQGRESSQGRDAGRQAEGLDSGRRADPSPDRRGSLDAGRSDPGDLGAGGDGPTAEATRSPSGGLGRGADEAPSLAQARASLRRAIVSLSEQAAQSDDPVRAKNLLEAANEGAEALSELGGDEV